MKFAIKNFFSKYDQIRRELRIWSDLLKKSLMENFIFWVVQEISREGDMHISQYSFFRCTLFEKIVFLPYLFIACGSSPGIFLHYILFQKNPAVLCLPLFRQCGHFGDLLRSKS